MSSSRKFTDVRMRGFMERTDVEVLHCLIEDRLGCLTAETVALGDAAGRVLTESVRSTVDVPAFRRSAMDGYALTAASTPGRFSVVGAVYPGAPFDAAVGAGQAVAIMTGAPLPDDCDCVVPVERVETLEGAIEVGDSFASGKNVARPGEDVTAGQQVLTAERVLRPQDLAMLASIGVAQIRVVRRPRVAIFATGNELLPCGSRPEGFRIVDSNSVMLAALVQKDGADVVESTLLNDHPDAIRAALAASESDLLVVSGGSSVGKEDYAPAVVAEAGELLVHGVNMRPAAPLGFGFVFGRPIFLLPGNPISCLCAYDVVLGRAVRRLGGRPADGTARRERLPLAESLSSLPGRLAYVRVQVTAGQVHPLKAIAGSGAANISGACRADGYVLLSPHKPTYEPGESVEVVFY